MRGWTRSFDDGDGDEQESPEPAQDEIKPVVTVDAGADNLTALKRLWRDTKARDQESFMAYVDTWLTKNRTAGRGEGYAAVEKLRRAFAKTEPHLRYDMTRHTVELLRAKDCEYFAEITRGGDQ